MLKYNFLIWIILSNAVQCPNELCSAERDIVCIISLGAIM